MNQLAVFLAKIKQQTGVDVRLYTESGLPIGKSAARFKPELPAVERFSPEGICVEEGENATYFIVESVPAAHFGRIAGADAHAAALCRMLKFILECGEGREQKALLPEEQLKLYILGTGEAPNAAEIKALLPGGILHHYLLLLQTKGGRQKQDELKEFLKNIADKGDFMLSLDATTLVYFKYSGESGDYQSASEFGRVLYENIKEEIRIELSLGIGADICALSALPAAYELVLAALENGKKLTPGRSVFHYKEFVLLQLLSALPKEQIAGQLDILTGGKRLNVLSDEELLMTADEFLKNSLNISETSRSMYIHRNTLIYRLDKIESETGLNLRNFGDAQTFQLLKTLSVLNTK